MRPRFLTCVALGAALAAAPAAAEVRLVDAGSGGDLAVEVASTPRGPWTPNGDLTARILNPSGDLFGDGMPGWDSRGPEVLSAWIRPGEGILHQSIGRGSGWNPLPPIESDGAQGQPVVDVLTGGWSIVWQKGSGVTAQVMVGGAAPDGSTAVPLPAATGVLIGTSASGDVLHVITAEGPSGQLWCTTIAFAFVPTQPIPIQLVIVARIPLRQIQLQPRNLPQGNGRGRPADRLELDEPRVRDVVLEDGTQATIVTWREGNSLHGVRIDGEGPHLPGAEASLRQGKDDVPALLQALR